MVLMKRGTEDTVVFIEVFGQSEIFLTVLFGKLLKMTIIYKNILEKMRGGVYNDIWKVLHSA